MTKLRVCAVILLIVSSSIFTSQAQAGANTNRLIVWSDMYEGDLEENLIYRLDATGGHPCPHLEIETTCNPKTSNLEIKNVLSPCEFSGPECISQIWIESADGSLHVGKYMGERKTASKEYSWDDNSIPGVGIAHSSNLYQFDGVAFPEGNLFEVIPLQTYSLSGGHSARPTNLSVKIRPVFLKSQTQNQEESCLENSLYKGQPSDFGPCWKEVPTNDYKFKVKFKFPKSPLGWITGRVSNIAIENSEGSFTISGKATQVATIEKNFNQNVPAENARWAQYASTIGFGGWELGYSTSLVNPPDSMDFYLKLLRNFSEFDKATALKNKWVVNFSWLSDIDPLGGKCSRDSIIGYAGSNAMTFSSQIPRFNSLDQSMDYLVAAPHFLPNDNLNYGHYELLITSKVAKCLWGLNQLPQVASISIVGEDGTKKIATTTFQEIGGFARFDASGFTFSKATIKVNLNFGSQTSVPPLTKSPHSGEATSKLLKCVKKSRILLIKSAPFKCPAGYSIKK